MDARVIEFAECTECDERYCDTHYTMLYDIADTYDNIMKFTDAVSYYSWKKENSE